MFVSTCNWDILWPFAISFKSYKNDSRFNRYNFEMVNAIDFLISTLHTTSFLSGKIDYGLLH